jgi:hypothetical protein
MDKGVLVFFLVLSCGNALFFTLEPKRDQCFNLNATGGRRIYGEYVVSGKGEDMAVCKVTAPSGKTEFLSPGRTKEGKFDIKGTETGTYKMCFRMLDSNAKTVSFHYEFVDSQTSEAVTATEKDLDPLTETLKNVSRQLDLIYRNLHFY